MSSAIKATNPKDAIGSDKLPIHLWPATATIMGCLGLLDGALKYGRCNWRVAGVRASIYIDAMMRHLFKLFEGEDIDPDSGLPHAAHILACAAIYVDALAAGKLNDDRMVNGGYVELVKQLTPHVARLKELHKDKSPKHYTIADSREPNPDPCARAEDPSLTRDDRLAAAADEAAQRFAKRIDAISAWEPPYNPIFRDRVPPKKARKK